MPKYRKKPVVIEAVQWDGIHASCLDQEWPDFQAVAKSSFSSEVPGGLRIETLEGTMTASEGDWIIRGVQGEFYPCKPDIFEATYEAVEETLVCSECESDLDAISEQGDEEVLWLCDSCAKEVNA